MQAQVNARGWLAESLRTAQVAKNLPQGSKWPSPGAPDLEVSIRTRSAQGVSNGHTMKVGENPLEFPWIGWLCQGIVYSKEGVSN